MWLVISTFVLHFFVSSTSAESVCNKTISLTRNQTTIDLASQKSQPFTCSWKLTSPEGTTIVVKVNDILLTGSLDRVVVLDGLAKNASVIQQCGLGCKLNDVVAVSSSNSMQVMISGDSSNADIRITSIQAWSQDGGGRFLDSGEITLGNSTSDKVYFQLHSTSYPDVKQMQLIFNDSLMNPASTISVYDGTTENVLLVKYNGLNQFVPVTGTGQDLLVVAEDMGDRLQYFGGVFSSVKPGCQLFSPGHIGEFSLVRSNLNKQCDWLINPSVSEGNVILEITSTSLCGDETLVVYEGLSMYDQRLMTVNQTTQLRVYPLISSTTKKGISIFVSKDKSNSTCDNTTTVFSGSYTVKDDCSADLRTSGAITSPFFPNLYSLNAFCTWSTKPTNKETSLYLSMADIDLTNGNTVSVTSDHTPVNLYTGSDLPSDLVVKVPSNTSAVIQFDSVTGSLGSGIEIPGQGFEMTYKVLECGYSINGDNGTIQSKTDVPDNALECIWVITVPPKTGNETVNIVSFSVDIMGVAKWQNLELRDGGRGDSMLLNAGVAMTKSMSLLTRFNTLWIHYRKNTTDLDFNVDSKFSFSLKFKTYSCDIKNQCRNGVCLHPDWRCDGKDDCGDNTDETGCEDHMTQKKGVKVWLTAVLCVVCFLFGVVVVLLVPALYKRWKYPNYSQFKDMIDPAIS